MTKKTKRNELTQPRGRHRRSSKKTRGPPVYAPGRCLSIHVFPRSVFLSVLHLHKHMTRDARARFKNERQRTSSRKNRTMTERTRKHNDDDDEENQTQRANPSTKKTQKIEQKNNGATCIHAKQVFVHTYVSMLPLPLSLSVLHLHKHMTQDARTQSKKKRERPSSRKTGRRQ